MIYRRVFAALYDRMLAGTERAGLAEVRERTLAAAHGRTLEIGAGTGLNLDRYPESVSDLVMAEPEGPMASRLRRRAESSPRPTEVVEAPAEELPFADDSFDTVAGTLVFCTVEDPHRALSEARRVLRPGGRLLFVEHVRSDDPGTARWQDRIDPLWKRIGAGCRCNRDTEGSIVAAGFEISELERGRMPKAPPWVRPMIAGGAIRPG